MEWISGKLVVVTGPTSGLGRQIALDLAAAGTDLVLACRDTSKGEAVAAEIHRRGGTALAEVMHIDTSSAAAITAFARSCRERHPRLDVLVNNAGLVQGERRETPEGLEVTFATNVLGYHRLSLALLDLLKAAAPARIVNVASSFAGDLDLDDLQFTRRPYRELEAYAQSKACDRLLTWALARRLASSGVTVNAMAPGFVQTGLSRNLSPDLRRAYSTRTGRTLAAGADTAVWLAGSAEVAGVTGTFFADRQAIPCEFRDTATEDRLWEICEALSRTM